MRGNRARGILCYPPQENGKDVPGVFMSLKFYQGWIEMAQLPEDKRTDQGRRFRI